MFSRTWEHLHVFALEAHDLALCKLERNSEKDREDVQQIAVRRHINPDVLEKRYYDELRPYLARPEWHDQTLGIWLDILRAI
jgi:Nucleotidyltransferase of unknown function (DUF6036)